MKNAHINDSCYYQATPSFFFNVLFISLFEEVLDMWKLCINDFETKY